MEVPLKQLLDNNPAAISFGQYSGQVLKRKTSGDLISKGSLELSYKFGDSVQPGCLFWSKIWGLDLITMFQVFFCTIKGTRIIATLPILGRVPRNDQNTPVCGISHGICPYFKQRMCENWGFSHAWGK
jgi:hypothetical protein